MNIGYCWGCKQKEINNKCELHVGKDGRGYCENCLEDLGEKERPRHTPVEGGRMEFPEPVLSGDHRRIEALDFIITKAPDQWVSDFVDRHADALKKNYSWIQILQNEPNELVILRLASELGYGKETTTVVNRLPPLSEIMGRQKIGTNNKGRKSKKSKT